MESTTASNAPVAQPNNQSTTAENVPAQQESQSSLSVKELEIDGAKVPLDKVLETYKKADSLNKASYQRFQEAAAAKKEAERIRLERESFKKRLAENFEEAAQELGLDPYELSEKAIRRKYEELTMSDEQRKMSETERELLQLRKFKEDFDRQQNTSKQQAFRNDVANYLDHNLGKAFESAKMDPDPYVVFAAATDIQNQLKEGVPIQHIDFNDCVTRAKTYRDNSFKRNPEKEIEEYLKDEKLAEKARQLLVNKVRNQGEKQFQAIKSESKTPRADKKKFFSPTEFREMMENEAKNG